MTADQFTAPGSTTRIMANAPNDPEDTTRRDRFGRYLVPKLTWAPRAGTEEVARTRATTFAKSISDTYNLSMWAQRMTAKGLAHDDELLAAVRATSLEDKSVLSDLVEMAKKAAGAGEAAIAGTAMHSHTETRDRAEAEDELDAHTVKHLDAYTALLAQHGITVQRMEEIVIWDKYGLAGRFDRIASYQGRPVILDLKTGKDLGFAWNEIAIQLAIYAHADAFWNPDTWAFERMPEGLDTSTAYVVHLPIAPEGTEPCATLYALNLEPAMEAIKLCHQVRQWRKTRNLMTVLGSVGEPAKKVNRWAERIDAATSQGELSTIWREASTTGQWTKALETRGKKRLAQISQPAG